MFRIFSRLHIAMLLLLALCGIAMSQTSTGTIQGTVTDNTGAVLPNAQVTATNIATNLSRTATTDSTGNYSLASLPPGTYSLEVKATGMAVQKIARLQLEVSRTLVQNFQVQVGNVTQEVTVSAETPVIESGTITVGGTVDQRTVQEIPLNGRHFIDLASLVPGTVVPPVQNAFLTSPLRGQGSFAIVTAGQREDTTNFMINGINLNDMANGQITFQPSIETVSEFKIDNSTPSADHGRSSGSVVNIATRSGTNEFHGQAFEYVRNDRFDARNFFNKDYNSSGVTQKCVRTDATLQGFCKNSFKRNQFGGDVGGPIWKNHTFFFASYEGLRQRQGLALTASVPSAQQRAKVTDPAVQKLLALVPVAPGGGPDPTKATDAVVLNSSAVAPVDLDQGTIDISHNFGTSDRLHGYYVFQRDLRLEPNNSGATIPGGGDQRQSHRQIFTLNETHIFSSAVVNDFRLGVNRIRISFASDSQRRGDDPTAFGVNTGLSGPIGLPHISIGGIGLQFGGEGNFPQARGDYTAVLSDSLSWLRGNHNFKFGGEVRRFNGNSILGDPGSVTFLTIGDFLGCTSATTCGNDRAASFSINGGGNHPARIFYNAIGLFAMDSWRLKPWFTAELGLRWEWIMTPTEAVNRSSLFNPAKDWFAQVGTNGLSRPFAQNNKLFQPRVGFSWDLFHNGKTVLRSGYGIMYDQLLPGPFVGSGNYPFGFPASFIASTTFSSFGRLFTDAGGALTGTGVTPNYTMPYVQSYNLNLQQEITPSLGIMIGYFGSKSTHLEEDVNINQITNGARPFPKVAADSPLAAGKSLSNINYRSSVGNANYNGLWVTGTKRVSRGLQFSTNYTWSKSLDYNSRNFIGSTFQNAFNIRGDYGPSDFDARHHFVFSSIYNLPWKGNRLVSGFRLSGDLTLQSGNPINIFAGTATGPSIGGFTGNSNIRPDLIGPLPSPHKTILTSGSNSGAIQWFNGAALVCDPRTPGSCTSNSVFAIPVTGTLTASVFHFGSMRRNAMIGPGFSNVDLSLSKTTKITERLSHEVRVEAFDLFNHPNFGNPGPTAQVGSAIFGIIRATRVPTGDNGSSRQIQVAMKLIF